MRVLVLSLVKLGVQQQLGHADYAVQRRAQLMAHRRDEHRLRVRGLNRLVTREGVLARQTLDGLPRSGRADVEVRERHKQQQHRGQRGNPRLGASTVCQRRVGLADLYQRASKGRGALDQLRPQRGNAGAASRQATLVNSCSIDIRHDRLDAGQLRACCGHQPGWHAVLGAGGQPLREHGLVSVNPRRGCGG